MSKAAVTLGVLGAVLGIAGLVVGSVALAKVQSPSPTAGSSVSSVVTVTSTPDTSSTDSHAAAVETCAAANTFRSAIGAVRQPYVDAAKSSTDWNSPDFIAIEGRYFGGAATELSYLTAHVSPATPQAISDAVTQLHKAATVLFDADVRREPGDASNEALAQLRTAHSAIESACEEAGAGK